MKFLKTIIALIIITFSFSTLSFANTETNKLDQKILLKISKERFLQFSVEALNAELSLYKMKELTAEAIGILNEYKYLIGDDREERALLVFDKIKLLSKYGLPKNISLKNLQGLPSRELENYNRTYGKNLRWVLKEKFNLQMVSNDLAEYLINGSLNLENLEQLNADIDMSLSVVRAAGKAFTKKALQ